MQLRSHNNGCVRQENVQHGCSAEVWALDADNVVDRTLMQAGRPHQCIGTYNLLVLACYVIWAKESVH